VVVVSGAFDVYLSHWCNAHQIELICSSLEHKDGVLTGRYSGPQCVRKEKAARVRKEHDLSRYERIYAYGDTTEDLDLLALAHEQYYQWRHVSVSAGTGA
jgi:HAD superfamily phosphoserine phosphatase-like hydrolase